MPITAQSIRRMMSSSKGIGVMAGIGLGGYLGFGRSRDEGIMDRTKDTAKMAAIGGGVGWYVGRAGLRNTAETAYGALSGWGSVAKAAMWNPLAKGGRGFKMGGWATAEGSMAAKGMKFGKGVLGGLAVLAASGAAIAYGSSRHSYRTDVAERDSSVRGRLNTMDAQGGMVFGLNNMRHG